MTGGPTLVPTENRRGYMHELSSVSEAFIQFCPHAPGAALDIGCAAGVATIPALQTGATVIGYDVDHHHLAALEANTPPELRGRLRIVQGRFPYDFPFRDSSIGAVLMSQVLGFLKGAEIREGFRRLYGCMAEGAKLFTVTYTPYISITEQFLPVYEARRSRGEEWPGTVDDLAKYCQRPELLAHLPNALNLMDAEVLTRELTQAGFVIEQAFSLGGEPVPRKFRLDGREWVAVFARK